MSFANARVLSFESRRAKEIAELIRINSGEPIVAPALVEAPIEENQQAFAFADRLYSHQFEMMIFLTGVGTRFLDRVLARRDPEQRFREALKQIVVVARGPKPTTVLREWNVPIAISVPEPNTWREVLAAVQARPEKRLAVQEYGRPNQELLQGLAAQGRDVFAVPVYQWKLPEDTGPLMQALDGLLAGQFGVALFTTGVQIEHFLAIANERGKREEAVEALRRTLVASIGPDCSENLRSCGIEPTLEPSHPKMGLLVREAAAKYAEINR